MRTTLAFLTVLLVALVVPLAAQETVPQPEDPPAVDELAPAEQAPSDATPTEPTPAWEFSLNASARAPGASGVVQITEGETENRFVVTVSGLPPHDSLDVEDFDAEAYTVWIVPSRERVPESTLAGFLVVDGSGAGRFEGATELDAFGIIVAGAKEEEPVLRGQGAVLTGIPTSPTPPAEAPPGEAAPPASAPESPAPEAPEDREPAYPG